MDHPEQKKILVIGNNDSLRFSICEFLEDRGYLTAAGETGGKGIELFNENPMDLVLTDLRMPGMSGIEVLDFFSRQYPDIPVIIISGTGDIRDVVSALKIGAWDYILKPVSDLSIIIHSIKQAFERVSLQKENTQYREKLEEMLHQRTHQLLLVKDHQQKVIDGISDMLVVVDRMHNITLVNKTASEFLKLTPGKDKRFCYEIFGNKNKPCSQCIFDRKGSSLKPIIIETSLINPATNNEIPFEIFDIAILDENGKIYEVIHQMRDISTKKIMEEEKRELEEMLHQNEKMKSIGQLAAGVAHDFNNMLGGIIGAAEILEHRFENIPREYKEYLEIILNSSQQAADLTAKLLAFGRKQKINLAKIDIRNVISDSIKLLENTVDKRITIMSELNTYGALINCDSTLLQNVFINLGINACQSMPEGGELTYSARIITMNRSGLPEDSKKTGSFVAIDVHDTGNGISPEFIPHIFEPFFTSKNKDKGTGLGLAAAYGTIEQHMGSITVKSKINQGTTFHILLPVSAEKKEKEKEEKVYEITAEIIHSGETILLVDDITSLRIVGKAMLESFGYEVLLAEDGEDAIDVYKKHRETIQLVILDMIMPKMNGQECFNVLKKMKPELKVILLSGFLQEKDLEGLREKGLSGVLLKPFAKQQLGELVAEVLSK